MHLRNAQSSLELILILAVSLVVLLSILTYSNETMGKYEKMMMQKKADSLLDKIHSTSEKVFMEGVDSKKRIYINIPEQVQNITINEKSIEIEFFDKSTRHASFAFDVAGEIPQSEGGHWIEVMSKKGLVLIASNVSKIESDYEKCGNNQIDLGEECDGTNMDGKDCTFFGYESGSLICEDCVLDTTECTEYPGEDCGDRIDNDLDGYIDCQDSDCLLSLACLPENCEDRTFCGQCTLDNSCTWCDGGISGSMCVDSCKKGRFDNCFGGNCIGDQTLCS